MEKTKQNKTKQKPTQNKYNQSLLYMVSFPKRNYTTLLDFYFSFVLKTRKILSEQMLHP